MVQARDRENSEKPWNGKTKIFKARIRVYAAN